LEKKAKYEILESLPPYGPMYIPVTDNNEPYYSEGIPVRFFKSDGTDWVANFKPGWTELAEVIELKDTENLLIIANGTCYLMNVEKTKPVKVFGVGYSNIVQTESSQIIIQDQTDLTIVEPNGEHCNTERISWDGLKEVKYENRIISGLSFDPMYDADEWIEFTYNLDTKTLIGGSFHRYDNRKPWWKFW
jgi:hypothetical protein